MGLAIGIRYRTGSSIAFVNHSVEGSLSPSLSAQLIDRDHGAHPTRMRLLRSGFGNPDRAGADEKYKGWCAVHTLQGYYKNAVVVVRIW